MQESMDIKQNTKRFVVPPGLTDEGQISEVLQLIVDINEQNGKLSDVVLFIPAKAHPVQRFLMIDMKRYPAGGLARLRWLLSDHESNSVELLIIL